MTFSYKALEDGKQQPTDPGAGGGEHPNDPDFGDAYETAGIEVKEAVSANGKITYTITGSEEKLLEYLSDSDNTIMNQEINGTTYAFIGFHFDSPKDADGQKAASAKMYQDGVDKGIGMDANGVLFQWIAVAKQDTDGNWVAHKVPQREFKNVWTMTDGTTIEQLWTCVNEITP